MVCWSFFFMSSSCLLSSTNRWSKNLIRRPPRLTRIFLALGLIESRALYRDGSPLTLRDCILLRTKILSFFSLSRVPMNFFAVALLSTSSRWSYREAAEELLDNDDSYFFNFFFTLSFLLLGLAPYLDLAVGLCSSLFSSLPSPKSSTSMVGYIGVGIFGGGSLLLGIFMVTAISSGLKGAAGPRPYDSWSSKVCPLPLCSRSSVKVVSDVSRPRVEYRANKHLSTIFRNPLFCSFRMKVGGGLKGVPPQNLTDVWCG